MNRNRRLWRVTCPVCDTPVRARHAEDTDEVLLRIGEHYPLGTGVVDGTGAPIPCRGGGPGARLISPPAPEPPARPSYEQTRSRP